MVGWGPGSRSTPGAGGEPRCASAGRSQFAVGGCPATPVRVTATRPASPGRAQVFWGPALPPSPVSHAPESRPATPRRRASRRRQRKPDWVSGRRLRTRFPPGSPTRARGRRHLPSHLGRPTAPVQLCVGPRPGLGHRLERKPSPPSVFWSFKWVWRQMSQSFLRIPNHVRQRRRGSQNSLFPVSLFFY